MFESATRREAIRKTVLFSASLLASKWLPRASAEDVARPAASGLHLLAVGDFGSKNSSQRKVAAAMARFSRELGQPLTAVLALGDNFYGRMRPGRFERDFEKMYDATAMPCPFHACIGNHDYERVSYGQKPEPIKCDIEMAYTRENPNSRWKLPSKWYALELPHAGQPLLKIIVLDSNYQAGALTPQEKLAQKRFLEAELAGGTKAPWLWLVWHHPLFTASTKRKDNARLLRVVEQALKSHPFSLCLSGHDHNLQHLRVEGYSPSFIISGAGGASRYNVKKSERGFTERTLGFNYFHVSPTRFEAQFINEEGKKLHVFERGLDGQIKVRV
jgi:hypothetical protein